MGGLVGVTAAPFTYVSHVLGAAAAVLVLVWCVQFRGGLAFESTNKSLIFNIHPVLMLIGFIILGGEAIMSYRYLPWSKEVKKWIHMILHAIAVVLGAVGIYATFKFHNESGIANLYSLHSWFGLGTICLYGIQDSTMVMAITQQVLPLPYRLHGNSAALCLLLFFEGWKSLIQNKCHGFDQ